MNRSGERASLSLISAGPGVAYGTKFPRVTAGFEGTSTGDKCISMARVISRPLSLERLPTQTANVNYVNTNQMRRTQLSVVSTAQKHEPRSCPPLSQYSGRTIPTDPSRASRTAQSS